MHTHRHMFFSLFSQRNSGYKHIDKIKAQLIYCNQKWNLDACCLKTNQEAALVENLLYFCCWQLGRGRADTCPKASPHHWQSVGNGFYRPRKRVTYKNSMVSSDSHFQIGHQHRFGWGTVSLHYQGLIVSMSLKPVLRIVAAYGMGMVWSSCSYPLLPDWGFSIHKTAHRI